MHAACYGSITKKVAWFYSYFNLPDGVQNVMSQSIDSDQIRSALSKICASNAFSGSARLQSLLTYVVDETLAGRGDSIRAKTIGLDVHKYSPDELADREGVVRVDAGRVRRKLEDYYARDGASDAVQISLPVGAYIPRFHAMTAAPADIAPDDIAPAGPAHPRWAIPVLGLLSVAVAVVAALYFFEGDAPPRDISEVTDTDRLGVYDISPRRVEAVNLAGIGRDLIFPAVDPRRLGLALDVFTATMERDDTYYGGYAGAAQVHATISMLSDTPEMSARAVEQAERFSRQSLRLGPEEAWALSAAAWAQFAAGDREMAASLSHRALQNAPRDPHIAEIDALIALYNLDFDRIIDLADSRAGEDTLGRNFVFQNALGAARFHTEDYRAAIATFEDAVASGAPFGPIGIAYLAASYQALGEDREAAALVHLLEQTWPKSRPDDVQRRLFSSAEPADQLTEALRAAGRTD